MLEDIGFKYMEEVDPFDGGPHYRSKLTDLRPYKDFCCIKKDDLSKNLNTNNIFISDETEKKIIIRPCTLLLRPFTQIILKKLHQMNFLRASTFNSEGLKNEI